MSLLLRLQAGAAVQFAPSDAYEFVSWWHPVFSFFSSTVDDNWGFVPPVGGSGTQMYVYWGHWSLRAGMGALEEWSFNQPVVSAISAFDADELIPVWILPKQDDEQFSQSPVFVQEELYSPLFVQYIQQELDSDQLHAEGFATDRMPEDFDQLIMTNQLALYWTDQDTSQSTFFSSEQYADADEQPIVKSWAWLQWTDDDKVDSTFFSQGQYSDQDEQFILFQQRLFNEEDFGQSVQFISIGQELEPIQILYNIYGADDSTSPTMWGFDTVNLEGPNTNIVVSSDEEAFGFQTQFIFVADDTLDQISNVPYPITHQVENDQIGQQSPFIVAIGFDDIDQYPIRSIVVDDVDTFGFQTVAVMAFDADELPVFSSQVMDDAEQSGYQPIFIPEESLALEMVSITIQGTDEDLVQSTFFSLEQYADFEESLVQQRTYWLSPGVEDEQFGKNAPFITSFPSDDAPEQLLNKPYPIVAEEDLVFPPSTILATMLYDTDFNPTMQQSYYFGSEDLEKYNWGWLPPMTKVTEDDSPYDSQPQLRSFYWAQQGTDEDTSQSTFFSLEQYAEGLEIQIPQSSYLFSDLATEQFDWGFNPSLPSMAFDQDELPILTLQRLFHEEDFGQQVQFVSDIGRDENITPWNIIRSDEESGMFGFGITAFLDGLDQLLSVRNVTVQEDEPFGFQTPVVVITTAFAEEDQVPRQDKIYADEEMFGFRTVFADSEASVQPITDFKGDGSIGQDVFTTSSSWPDFEGVPEYGKFNFAPAEDARAETIYTLGDEQDIFPLAPQYRPSQDEDVVVRVIQQPFSFGDEIDHVPNPPYPVTYQVEFDQVGLNAPFITSQPFAWEEAGIPPNQPWPVLDVTDYNDFIINQLRIVPIFFRLRTSPVVLIDDIISSPLLLIREISAMSTTSVSRIYTELVG